MRLRIKAFKRLAKSEGYDGGYLFHGALDASLSLGVCKGNKEPTRALALLPLAVQPNTPKLTSRAFRGINRRRQP